MLTEEHEVVDLAVRVLRAVMSDPVLRSQTLLDILPRIFPWSMFLPPEDRIGFAQELVDVMDASSELGVSAPVLTLIAAVAQHCRCLGGSRAARHPSITARG